MGEHELYRRWREVCRWHPRATQDEAADALGVTLGRLRRAVAVVESLSSPAPPLLVMRCLLLHADALDVDGHPELGERMRARASAIEDEARAA